MQWSDEGIVLSARPHGETSAIAELLTRDHGRHLGLVRGGRSKRMRPVLQAGNLVQAGWRARLSEHLGSFSLELMTPHAAMVLDDRASLAGLNTLVALSQLLPERDPHESLYDAAQTVLGALSNGDHWPALLVRWELGLLNELGFGLDMDACAATGTTTDLVYISPRTGRAVSCGAGEPYKDKLLPLPAFLLAGNGNSVGNGNAPSLEEISDGFRLTGYFFDRHIWGPRGLKPPRSRAQVIAMLSCGA